MMSRATASSPYRLPTLVKGRDFVSDPRLDTAGVRLCWLTWDKPNMPWDGTELWVARGTPDGAVVDSELVAGGPEESVIQPSWAPDGSLVFISDRTDWWNLYRWRNGGAIESVAPMEAEIGGPQWVFGLRSYAIDAEGRIVAIARQQGHDRLLVLEAGGPRAVPLAQTELEGVSIHNGSAVLVAGGPIQPEAVTKVDLATGEATALRAASQRAVDAGCLSQPRQVEFPTAGGLTAFAWYYPPTNPDVVAPDGELPPLVVMSHGGPTASASTGYNLGLQAFTSRGLAVVDVDYGGSTGYGRRFRNRLRGAWGVVDLEDCTNVATWLADQGLADRNRLAIRGGSAGGFTTLAALAFRDVFAAGASYFGVGDLEALARDTHKFESRYLDLIVAPYPERVDVYRERSPIHHVDRISCPVLVLQGTEDKVVPQAQADEIVDALRKRRIPYAYLLFQGEGHGFRRAENQRRSREAELSFYAQVFGYRLADDFPPVEVAGLSPA
jgi:dipeptidyl aminopeptidase/acylaminoacyl peptidase